jgi:hypothetical protein
VHLHRLLAAGLVEEVDLYKPQYLALGMTHRLHPLTETKLPQPFHHIGILEREKLDDLLFPVSVHGEVSRSDLDDQTDHDPDLTPRLTPLGFSLLWFKHRTDDTVHKRETDKYHDTGHNEDATSLGAQSAHDQPFPRRDGPPPRHVVECMVIIFPKLSVQ